MNHKIKWYPVVLLLCMAIVQCTKYDEYKKYMPDGEIIYPQKADSVKTYPGRNRILLEWVIVDPKVTSCKVFYEHEGIQNSITEPIQARGDYSNDTIRVIIPDLEEAIYSFKIVSYDDFGHASIPVEADESAFGEAYESSLLNRAVKSAVYDADEGNLQLEWFGADNSVVGVNLSYTDIYGDRQTLLIAQTETAMTIPDIEVTEPVMYTTMHKPHSLAIDTFSTNPQKIDILGPAVNIVLNKPVTHSDFLDGFPGQNAVDGNKTDAAARWVSDDSNSEHWIEIDLQGSFAISAFSLWRQNYEPEPMQRWRLQVWIDNEWITVYSDDNAPSTIFPIFYGEFETIITNRVRWYLPAYTNNRVRLYEIEVYSITRY